MGRGVLNDRSRSVTRGRGWDVGSRALIWEAPVGSRPGPSTCHSRGLLIPTTGEIGVADNQVSLIGAVSGVSGQGILTRSLARANATFMRLRSSSVNGRSSTPQEVA
jgi:hypothetical protein